MDAPLEPAAGAARLYGAPMDALLAVSCLDPAGWQHSDRQGWINDGWPEHSGWDQPQGGDYAFFKHSQPINTEDVVRMKVDCAGSAWEADNAFVGFARQHYDPKKDDEARSGSFEEAKSKCKLGLCDNTTLIGSDISHDGQDHDLAPRFVIPEAPFDLALRCDKDGNVPQIQFNDDGVWHDFAPEGRTGLVAGPWFLCLQLNCGDCITNIRVDRPRPTKSAGKIKSPARGID